MANVTYSGRPRGQFERVLRIDEFRGVDQSRGVFSGDYSTSPDAVNFIARDGVLRTAGGLAQYGPDIPFTPDSETPNSKPRLFQSYFQDASGNPVAKLIASFNRKLHLYNPGTNTWSVIGAVAKDGCDLVSYRHEDEEWAILTDGAGEMYRWNGTGSFVDLNVTQGEDEITHTPIEIKFEQIALLYERLFGGVFKDSPDRIYWSDSFSPDNWEFNTSLPDEGGGFLDIPTFDGSKVRAISTALGDVLIFKDHSIHRLSGTYPGEFSVNQVYGVKGTISPRTIINIGSKVYFLSDDGLCVYDGMTVSSMRSAGDMRLKDVWSAMDHDQMDKACAVLYNNVIYLSVCLNPAESANTHVVEYDTVTGQYSVVNVPGIDDFIVLRDGLDETLLAIAWNKVYRYDSGASFAGQPINAAWTSPEITFGSMASKKVTGYVYITVDAATLDVGASPRMKISMLSGDRVSAKIIPLDVGVNSIRKRIKIRGRSIRFRLENLDGNPLTIRRGIEIMVEEDAD